MLTLNRMHFQSTKRVIMRHHHKRVTFFFRHERVGIVICVLTEMGKSLKAE